jgi:hypothetical protein
VAGAWHYQQASQDAGFNICIRADIAINDVR